MTRLIDADALIDKLEKEFEVEPCKSIQSSLIKSVCLLFCKVIELEPTVYLRKVTQDYASHTTIDAAPKWIPCSERLPEIKGHYVSETCLVCLDNGAIGFSELQENIFGQVGWSCEREDDYHEPLGDVIAWMPLPKPYEVEND